MNIKGKLFLSFTITVLCTTVPLHPQYPKKKQPNRFKTETNITMSEEQKTDQVANPNLDMANDTRSPSIESKPSKPMYPPTATDDKDDMIEVNLEKTDLENLLSWIEEVFNVTFLTNDTIQPPAPGGTIKGNKINFKTQSPLTKKQVWDLFLTFLDLFGFALSEGSLPNFYKVRPTALTAQNSISKSPLASYININWLELPNNDTPIRFVYFVKNSTLATIQGIVEAFKSQTATLKPLQELNAFILTDKASNVRSIMQIVEELDSVSMPQAMSVLKLKNADAEEVSTLYDQLTKAELEPRGLAARILGQKKQPTTIYFPESLRLIPEKRTNTLIILGDKEGINKVEEFIINYVDVELKVPYSPLYVYELQYTRALDIVEILKEVTQFAKESPAAKSGGVREGDKYLQPMTFVAEESGNRVLIRAEKEDYLKIRDVIKQLDVKQPQIAIEVLIVNVRSTDNRELGIQIRNKDEESISKNINFQTSGFPLGAGSSAPVINPNSDPQGSLLANLITLAQNQSPGATLISIANKAASVWAMFKVLQDRVNAEVVANPFLITTNKYPAAVSIGEIRRVVNAEIAGTRNVTAQDDVTANLTVKITPQINSIGIINLVIDINIDTFSDATDPTDANKDTKQIKTNANVGNRQVLALGGLLKTNHDETFSKVPLFGDIPVIGWLFKNKQKVRQKDNLLIFISPRIIEPNLQGGINSYTKEKIDYAKNDMGQVHSPAEQRDPIHRWFFKDKQCENIDYLDNFIAKQNPKTCIAVPESLYCTESCIDENKCVSEQPIEIKKVEEPPCTELEQAQAETAKPQKRRRSITNLLPHEHQGVHI
jgi:general secretion pathway protein D